MKIQVLVFMSEIKIDLTLKKKKKKKKKKFCFFFAFIYNNLASTSFSTLASENKRFSSHFASIWSCLACLGGIYS